MIKNIEVNILRPPAIFQQDRPSGYLFAYPFVKNAHGDGKNTGERSMNRRCCTEFVFIYKPGNHLQKSFIKIICLTIYKLFHINLFIRFDFLISTSHERHKKKHQWHG